MYERADMTKRRGLDQYSSRKRREVLIDDETAREKKRRSYKKGTRNQPNTPLQQQAEGRCEYIIRGKVDGEKESARQQNE
jgi:hypothetical protein